MTVEQFIVGSIIVIIATAWSTWSFLFMPRLDEVQDQLAKWRARAEIAEHELRQTGADSIVTEGDWGTSIPMPWEDQG